MSDLDIENLGEDVPLLEAMRTARAIRRLRTDPVPPALIRKVCEAGTFAPSGGNRQPWIFVAVTEAERRAWIAERYRARFREYILPALERAEADPEFPEAKVRNMRAALHLADGPEIDAYLGLSESTPSCALLPIGWPVGRHGRPPRASVDEKLYFERVPEGAIAPRR